MIILSRRQVTALREIGAWALGRRRRVRVEGASMEPTLLDGQFVLVDEGRHPAVGELAVARHPTRAELLVVKRVAAIDADGGVEVASDNPAAGSDSRTWGPLPPGSVLGSVSLLLDRPSTRLDRWAP